VYWTFVQQRKEPGILLTRDDSVGPCQIRNVLSCRTFPRDRFVLSGHVLIVVHSRSSLPKLAFSDLSSRCG
jgi:hypothetical protein